MAQGIKEKIQDAREFPFRPGRSLVKNARPPQQSPRPVVQPGTTPEFRFAGSCSLAEAARLPSAFETKMLNPENAAVNACLADKLVIRRDEQRAAAGTLILPAVDAEGSIAAGDNDDVVMRSVRRPDDPSAFRGANRMRDGFDHWLRKAGFIETIKEVPDRVRYFREWECRISRKVKRAAVLSMRIADSAASMAGK